MARGCWRVSSENDTHAKAGCQPHPFLIICGDSRHHNPLNPLNLVNPLNLHAYQGVSKVHHNPQPVRAVKPKNPPAKGRSILRTFPLNRSAD